MLIPHARVYFFIYTRDKHSDFLEMLPRLRHELI